MTDFVYHETQDSQLCGQHCLNNLLQEPYFTTVDLANIAEELDGNERNFFAGNAHGSKDSQEFMKDGFANSSNVDESGNFSIQVLKLGLQRFHNIELVSWTGEEVRNSDPTQEKGFVINCRSHWYTVRNIRSTWWNLDSLQNSPMVVSPFFLSAFLSQLREEGHSVFLAKGNISPSGKAPSDPLSFPSNCNWHREQSLLSGSSTNETSKKPTPLPFAGKGNKLGGTSSSTSIDSGIPADLMDSNLDEETMLAMAIQLSQIEAEQMKSRVVSQSQYPAAIKLSEKEELRKKRLAALERSS